MMIDWNKALEAVATAPPVKRFVSSMRDKGVAEHLIALGLANRRGSMLGPAIGFFAIGAVCGAAAAMLLTPRTGDAFRQDVAELFKNLGSKVNEQVASRRAEAEERKNGAAAS